MGWCAYRSGKISGLLRPRSFLSKLRKAPEALRETIIYKIIIIYYPSDNRTLTIEQVIFTAALIKKENHISLICKEIQNGAVAKSYMTNGLLIYG